MPASQSSPARRNPGVFLWGVVKIQRRGGMQKSPRFLRDRESAAPSESPHVYVTLIAVCLFQFFR